MALAATDIGEWECSTERGVVVVVVLGEILAYLFCVLG